MTTATLPCDLHRRHSPRDENAFQLSAQAVPCGTAHGASSAGERRQVAVEAGGGRPVDVDRLVHRVRDLVARDAADGAGRPGSERGHAWPPRPRTVSSALASRGPGVAPSRSSSPTMNVRSVAVGDVVDHRCHTWSRVIAEHEVGVA